MLTSYLTCLQAQGKSMSSIETRRLQLTAFFNWLQLKGGTEQEQITASAVVEYCSYLREKGLKPNAINTHRASIYSYCAWLVEEGYMPYNPVAEVRRERVTLGDYRHLDESQQYRLMRACLSAEHRKSAMTVLVLLYTGIRVSEIIRLAPDDVLIESSKGAIVVRDSDGLVNRVVPLHPRIRSVLAEYVIKSCGFASALFKGQNGGRITARAVQLVCRKLGHQAGIPDLSPDILRHTYMYNLLKSGFSGDKVAVLLGISQIDPHRIPCLRA